MRHTSLRRNCEVDSLFHLNIQTEYIDHIHIWAAKADLAVAGSGRCTAVTEDVNVRKSHMHGHRPNPEIPEAVFNSVPSPVNAWVTKCINI